MATVTHLPHIKKVTSGRNYYDPMHSAIFEVEFSLPDLIQSKFTSDLPILTEQVVSVSGLDALQHTTTAGQQKFLGADVSYLNPTLDNTYAELSVVLNLNIRNVTDNFVLRAFKEWETLSYNLNNGVRHLMADYVADTLTINQANRDGTIFRSVTFYKVMLTGVTGIDELNYTNNEACQITVSFRADYWTEETAPQGSGAADRSTRQNSSYSAASSEAETLESSNSVNS